jgi:hypothetical protein
MSRIGHLPSRPTRRTLPDAIVWPNDLLAFGVLSELIAQREHR